MKRGARSRASATDLQIIVGLLTWHPPAFAPAPRSPAGRPGRGRAARPRDAGGPPPPASGSVRVGRPPSRLFAAPGGDAPGRPDTGRLSESLLAAIFSRPCVRNSGRTRTCPTPPTRTTG